MRPTSRAVVVVSFASMAVAATSALQTNRPVSLLLDRAYMHDVRARGEQGDAAIRAAIATLEADAKTALAIGPMSVLDKAITPPSGDRHDYMSQAPYWWPDPSRPDGTPYIRKDGERNPEISRITDRDNLGRLGDAVTTLSLAYAYTGHEEYATHAARLVRAWFLDPATRMNPHLQFGQYIPGINQGRGIGIIETRNLPELLDGVMLISGSPAWTKADEDGVQAWMRAYLTWLVESTHGREESKNGNNHETWYDVQVAALALYTGHVDVARRTLDGARARIAAQIEPDGRQPRELERTRSWHYSEFNLAAFMDLATLGRHVGVDLWTYRTPDGRSIRQAVDFMVPYAAGERKWAFDQITPFSPSTLHAILRRGAVAWSEPKYKAVADRIGGVRPRLILTIP
jgi:Alginate lyase